MFARPIAAAALLAAALASAGVCRAQGNQGVDGDYQAATLDGTAADGSRFYEWDCNDSSDPATPSADRVKLWCDGTGAGDPTVHWTLPNGTKYNVPLNSGAANQNPASLILDGKGEMPVGQGGGSAATTMSPGADGTYKQADSSQATGWTDKKPLILEQAIVRTTPQDRGTDTTPDPDDVFTFSAAASTTYVLILHAGWRSAGVATDLEVGWDIPSGATVDGGFTTTEGVVTSFQRVNADVTGVVFNLVNGTLAFHATAKVTTSGSGTVALWWSSDVGGAGETCELVAGSTLLVYRVQS